QALWPRSIPHSDGRIQWMRRALPYVRRALANISVYMVMDDHEITDDWNMTKSWETRVKRSKTGRRIVANGLAAYWIFQAWGNNPDLFSQRFVDTLVGYLGERSVTSEEYESALITPDDPKQWFFVAPTSPPVFFLDSRTRR